MDLCKNHGACPGWAARQDLDFLFSQSNHIPWGARCEVIKLGFVATWFCDKKLKKKKARGWCEKQAYFQLCVVNHLLSPRGPAWDHLISFPSKENKWEAVQTSWFDSPSFYFRVFVPMVEGFQGPLAASQWWGVWAIFGIFKENQVQQKGNSLCGSSNSLVWKAAYRQDLGKKCWCHQDAKHWGLCVLPVTTTWMSVNKGSASSPGSGVQKCKIKVSGGLHSLWRL